MDLVISRNRILNHRIIVFANKILVNLVYRNYFYDYSLFVNLTEDIYLSNQAKYLKYTNKSHIE